MRGAAFVIDSVIVAAGSLLLRFALFLTSAFLTWDVWGTAVLFHYTAADILIYGLGVLYFVLLTYETGTTPGKRLLNLRVIGTDGERPTLFQLLYRETVGRFLCGFLLGAGYMMAGIDRQKRGLHDILSDTYVVYEKRIPVSVYQRNRPVPTECSAEQKEKH